MNQNQNIPNLFPDIRFAIYNTHLVHIFCEVRFTVANVTTAAPYLQHSRRYINMDIPLRTHVCLQNRNIYIL